MPPDVLVTVPGTEAAPLSYQVAPGQELILKAAFARFDGSGAAGSFFPCLRITDANGHLVGEYISDSAVAAGASADVSFAPFLSRGSGSSGGSGIQFATEPQSGTWLEVETTSADPSHSAGIYFKQQDGMQVVTGTNGGAAVNGGFALYVENANSTQPLAGGIQVLVTTTNPQGSTGTAAINAKMEGTGTTGDATGIQAVGQNDNGLSNHSGIGGFLKGISAAAATSFGAQTIGQATAASGTRAVGVQAQGTNLVTGSDPTTMAVGVAADAELRGTSGVAPGGTLYGHASQATSVLAFARTNKQETTGLVVDVGSGTGTCYLIRGWVNNTKILEIDASGNIHIPVAASVINDL